MTHVILQFFTRYVLNNSLAWTEEIAINCLIVTVFLGSAMCVRLSRHIRVDFIYRILPRTAGRWLALVVDLVTIGFFAYMTWLFWRYVAIVGNERMVTVNLPRGIVFYAVLAAFATGGAEVSVLCFTHGEASTLHGVDGDLFDLRADELAAASTKATRVRSSRGWELWARKTEALP